MSPPLLIPSCDYFRSVHLSFFCRCRIFTYRLFFKSHPMVDGRFFCWFFSSLSVAFQCYGLRHWSSSFNRNMNLSLRIIIIPPQNFAIPTLYVSKIWSALHIPSLLLFLSLSLSVCVCMYVSYQKSGIPWRFHFRVNGKNYDITYCEQCNYNFDTNIHHNPMLRIIVNNRSRCWWWWW